MTINYTTNLGLAEPVTGTESGTWGDDVNKGITDYLDIAIAGTQTISGTQTAVTLSITNGSSSANNIAQVGSNATGSAQYQIINCTGSPASTLTITAPASSKTYVVINATSTTQSVKVVGTGPTTGVTVLSGEKALIVWNGSDFVKVSNTSGAGVFSSITNTSLTSGRVVYSTTGGLETDSANLTFNGTTLTANTLNLTNALGTAYGGTGLTSFTANGVLYASGTGTLATGSALTFDGTNFATTGGVTLGGRIGFSAFSTDIDNFGLWVSSATSATTLASFSTNPIAFRVNNTEQMRLTSTGLGIGTSSPSAKLEVKVAAVSSVNAVFSNGQNAQTLTLANSYNYNSDGGGSAVVSTGALLLRANSNNLLLDSSGNLGLGVTPSAWNGSYKNIQIPSGSYFATSGQYGFFTSNVYLNGSAVETYISNGAAMKYTHAVGQHQWHIAPSGTAGSAISFSQVMTLDSSGNLLVGTTSNGGTNAKFEVDYAGSYGAALVNTNNTSGTNFLSFYNSTFGSCGSISRVTTTNVVTYNTTSDYRLKTLIAPVIDSGTRLDALNPVEYEWKETGHRARGFFAHEFQQVYADSVTGEKDAVDEDGKPIYQAMQASTAEVIADLVAEIQSLRKRLAALEAK